MQFNEKPKYWFNIYNDDFESKMINVNKIFEEIFQ